MFYQLTIKRGKSAKPKVLHSKTNSQCDLPLFLKHKHIGETFIVVGKIRNSRATKTCGNSPNGTTWKGIPLRVPIQWPSGALFTREGLFQSFPNVFISVLLFHRDNSHLRSVTGASQLRECARMTSGCWRARRAEVAVHAVWGFTKARDQAGLWSGQGVGGAGILQARHKELAACSFMGKVLLVLGWFFFFLT